jgi:hypothetical protein
MGEVILAKNFLLLVKEAKYICNKYRIETKQGRKNLAK